MDAREALYTTRAMRRVKPDSIPESVQARILDAAVRAPSGGNSQDWRFLLVDDADLRGQLATIYADCLSRLWSGPYKEAIAAADFDPTDAVEFWDQVNREDWHICELTQRGMNSARFTPGRYTTQESDVQVFDQMVASRYLAALR